MTGILYSSRGINLIFIHGSNFWRKSGKYEPGKTTFYLNSYNFINSYNSDKDVITQIHVKTQIHPIAKENSFIFFPE